MLDPVVHLVPIRRHLRRPGGVGARDDRRADDLQVLRVDAVDDVLHARHELVGGDIGGEIVRPLEEDHLDDSRACEHVAIEAVHRSGAATRNDIGHAVASDAFVDEREILIVLRACARTGIEEPAQIEDVVPAIMPVRGRGGPIGDRVAEEDDRALRGGGNVDRRD